MRNKILMLKIVGAIPDLQYRAALHIFTKSGKQFAFYTIIFKNLIKTGFSKRKILFQSSIAHYFDKTK